MSAGSIPDGSVLTSVRTQRGPTSAAVQQASNWLLMVETVKVSSL